MYPYRIRTYTCRFQRRRSVLFISNADRSPSFRHEFCARPPNRRASAALNVPSTFCPSADSPFPPFARFRRRSRDKSPSETVGFFSSSCQSSHIGFAIKRSLRDLCFQPFVRAADIVRIFRLFALHDSFLASSAFSFHHPLCRRRYRALRCVLAYDTPPYRSRTLFSEVLSSITEHHTSSFLFLSFRFPPPPHF